MTDKREYNRLRKQKSRRKPEVRERERVVALLAYSQGRREQFREIARQARRDPDKWSAYAIPAIKHRAKEKGLDFDLTAADIPLPQVCPVLVADYIERECVS